MLDIFRDNRTSIAGVIVYRNSQRLTSVGADDLCQLADRSDRLQRALNFGIKPGGHDLSTST